MGIKPQLTIQDFGGHHNADMEGTRARLIRGGSYKRQRVIVIVPAIAPIPPKVYLSHLNLIFPPNNGVIRVLAEGMEVGDAYSQAITNILNHPELSKWEYILCIETDNSPPSDGAIQLIEDLEQHPEYAAVGGLYYCKGPSSPAQIWGAVTPENPVTNFIPQVPVPNTLQECCGLGQGFTMFRLSVFKDERIPRPWFRTLASKEGCATQDLFFWQNARKFGYRCAVDTRVRVGHYDFEGKFGQPDFMW